MATSKQLVKTFGNVLRRLRLDARLSQEQLGLDCDLHPNYVSLLERGLRQPSLTTIFKLAERLDIAPGQLITLVESEL